MSVLHCSRTRSHASDQWVTVAPRSRVRHAMPLVMAACLAITAACKEAAEPPKVAVISGMGDRDSMTVGTTFQYPIELRDAAGNVLTGRKVMWTSQNPQVASVDEAGVITGLAVGPSLITAKVDGVVAQSMLFVQPAVASVVILPQTSSVVIGETRGLTVAVTDKDGKTISGRSLTWSSSNPSIATVNSEGVVAGVSIGDATITARTIRDGISGTATVQVVQVPVASVSISPAGTQLVFEGTTLQLSAVARDGSNNVLNGRPVSWTTSNQAVATVSETGLVTGVGLGSAQITAEVEGKTASSQVNVAPRPIVTIALSPNPASVKAGSAIQMTLDMRDAGGAPLTTAGRTVTWDSSNKPVATVQDGVVTGLTPGTATITVIVDGKSASAIVTVTPPTP